MITKNCSLNAGKRRRQEEDGASAAESDSDGTPATDFDSLEKSMEFNDTLLALRIIIAQFPRIDKQSIQPFVLRSQLYSSVKDRTQVDRELEKLRNEKRVRVFKLNTGQDDHAIMFLDDYLLQAEYAVQKVKEDERTHEEAFDWFKNYVIDEKLDSGIHHNELWSLLSRGGKVKEAHVSFLINAGLLIRQLIDSKQYWFAIPGIGPLLKGLSQGRKEVISIVKRRRYKEMMLSQLEKVRLRQSPFDIRFHLRDLIGSSLLKSFNSPSGIVVRISKD